MEETTSDIAGEIEASVPGFRVETVEFEGEGDFCRAYTVNGEWIFRFAYNPEGSCALELETAVLPRLVPAVRVLIPDIAYSGQAGASGMAFVGYRKIAGTPLTPDLLSSLAPGEQEEALRDLAGFLRDLHSFDLEEARRLGVPECGYPFARTEEGTIQGSASEVYGRELARLVSYPVVDEACRAYCTRLVDDILAEEQAGELSPALVHGDLSAEHVLFDPRAKRIAGVIDFTDVIITTPLLDLVYVCHAYGPAFFGRVLDFYGRGDPARITARVQHLHHWYLAIRLLWALDHDYEPGIDARLGALRALATSTG